MSAALTDEARVMAAMLREAATISDAAGLPANATRYRLAADLIDQLRCALSPLTVGIQR